MKNETNRQSDYPIQPMILHRWSSRAMSGESLTNEELMPLFEAARWAPSSYNNQPWRFLYVKRDTLEWKTLFNLLIDFNKEWCANAAVLGIIYSCLTFEKTGKPCITHGLDTGAAWENLALEGTSRGLVVHGMQGFDLEKAKALIPSGHEVLAMFAVGKKGKKELLSLDLQSKEVPSQRKKISEFAFELTK
jgi:nitroreductase